MKAGLSAAEAVKMSDAAHSSPYASFQENELSRNSIPRSPSLRGSRIAKLCGLDSSKLSYAHSFAARHPWVHISTFQFLIPPLGSVPEKQLEHKEPCSHHNGGIGKVKGVPVIPAVVNVQEIHNSADSNAVEEI